MRTLRFFDRYWLVPAVISLVVETGLLIAASWTAYQVRGWILASEDSQPWEVLSTRVLLFTVVVILSLYFGGHYDFSERFGRRVLWIRIARSLSISLAILLSVYWLTEANVKLGRGTLLLALLLSGLLLAGWRELLGWLLRKSLFTSRILIVGADESATELASEVLHRKHLGYRIIGFLDDDPELLGVSLLNPRVIGSPAEASQLAMEHGATMIVVALKDKRGKLDLESLLKAKTFGIPVQEGSSFLEQLTGRISLESLRASWLVFSDGFVVSAPNRLFKRLTDIFVAAVLLVVTAPVMLLTALAVRLESPGPILYRQKRVGFRGRSITLLKFRSMVADAEAHGEAKWAQEKDPRITRVGKLLRTSRLDELPQLWNILAGDMSLVGPRPERQPFVEELRRRSSFYDQRHEVRPGLTGWAQIMAPYASSMEESLEKLEYDLFYIKNMSLFLDLSIMASTARIVFLGRGAR